MVILLKISSDVILLRQLEDTRVRRDTGGLGDARVRGDTGGLGDTARLYKPRDAPIWGTPLLSWAFDTTQLSQTRKLYFFL